jgi:nucleoid DNA-binding protein
MESKEYLKQVVNALVNGNETEAKEIHHAYVEQKSQELLKEDKISLKGAVDFIKKTKAAIAACDPKDIEKLKELRHTLSSAEEQFENDENENEFDK